MQDQTFAYSCAYRSAKQVRWSDLQFQSWWKFKKPKKAKPNVAELLWEKRALLQGATECAGDMSSQLWGNTSEASTDIFSVDFFVTKIKTQEMSISGHSHSWKMLLSDSWLLDDFTSLPGCQVQIPLRSPSEAWPRLFCVHSDLHILPSPENFLLIPVTFESESSKPLENPFTKRMA